MICNMQHNKNAIVLSAGDITTPFPRTTSLLGAAVLSHSGLIPFITNFTQKEWRENFVGRKINLAFEGHPANINVITGVQWIR